MLLWQSTPLDLGRTPPCFIQESCLSGQKSNSNPVVVIIVAEAITTLRRIVTDHFFGSVGHLAGNIDFIQAVKEPAAYMKIDRPISYAIQIGRLPWKNDPTISHNRLVCLHVL